MSRLDLAIANQLHAIAESVANNRNCGWWSTEQMQVIAAALNDAAVRADVALERHLKEDRALRRYGYLPPEGGAA
jgi:hypothetical protein